MFKKVGFVALVGKPNAGKSTLLNAIVSHKVAITSGRPQTTRNLIYAIYEDEGAQIVFVDSPGFHHPRNLLDAALNRDVERIVGKAEVACFLSDITRPVDDEDRDLLQHLAGKTTLLLISKAEMARSQDVIDQRIAELTAIFPFKESILVSGLHHKNVEKLLQLLETYLPTGEPLDGTERERLAGSDRWMIAEVIREQCLLQLRQEIPYGIMVEVEREEYTGNLYKIWATIIVEKKSQKPIVIGKAGQMLREIGTRSREELLKIYDAKIFLNLFVKVDPDWRNNQLKINEFGYGKDH